MRHDDRAQRDAAHEHDGPGPVHEHDRGLSHDLPTLLSRRKALGLLGGAGMAALAACAGASTGTSEATTTPSASASGSSSAATGTEEIPEETAGPYPADGSNGTNVLTESGIVRSDLTRSFGTGSAVAAGVPLAIELTVLDLSEAAAALSGAAVYLWHCDRDGRYSMYDESIRSENYLRGVQEAGSDGKVRFTSIYPAAYSGRWPHIHFEVYESLAKATAAADKLRTSQLALPEDVSRTVYATEGYEQSIRNLEQTSLESDNVFGDGYSLQLARVTGSADKGLTATLTVPV
jgi:protocatechuate 3,4-dioxygenase beta subunit